MAEPFLRIAHPDVDGEATVSLSSVPGHAARGWVVIGPVDGTATDTVALPATLTRPTGNASTDAWRTYAVAAYVLGAGNGLSYTDAMSASRDELAAHFNGQPDLPTDEPADTPTDQES